MQGLQHRHQAVLVDHFLFGGECRAGLQFLQHVIHAGQREIGVLRLLALAMRVELFGEIADAGFQRRINVGKWKRLEASSLVVARVIANAEPPTRRKRPSHMNFTRQHAKKIRVVDPDRDQHVVRQNRRVEKLKRAVFRGFYCSHVTRQTNQHRS